jgi:hypothetical protein
MERGLMVKQIPTAIFPGKNAEPQATEVFVDQQRRIMPNWRRWTEFVDISIRRFAALFTFLALEDTPDSYSGQAGKLAAVNMAEDALEFIDPTSGTGDFVGPASSTTHNFVQFADGTGKEGEDGGLSRDTDGTLAANSDTKIPSQKAVKTYIDAKLAGLSWKQAVRAATTAGGTLASSFENGDSIDGVTLATGDRILIKNQATAADNGIYVVAASGAPARATDADSGAELVNASCYVSEGSTNADTQWCCTTNAPITVGATSLAFAQLSSGSYTDENAQDAVGAMVDATIVYVDGTPLLTRAALTGDVTAPQASNVTTLGSNFKIGGVGATFGDTAGAVLTAGSVVYFTCPFAGTIAGWNITVDGGTCTFDIWKIASGTAIPTVSNTITASALPAISTGTAIHSTTLTAWTTSVAANDIFGIQLKTVATAKYAELDIQINRT